MSRLREWRDAAWPGISITSIVTAAIVTALDQVRLPIDRTGLCVLVDGRRYLPEGSMPSGNFAVGQFDTPLDSSDPSAVHAAIHDVIDTGRPLPTIALGDLRGLLARRTTGSFDSAPISPQLRISVSHLGPVDFLGHLPWSDRLDDRRLTIVSNPAAPEDVTITSVEYADALHLTASFHATTSPLSWSDTPSTWFATIPREDPVVPGPQSPPSRPTPHVSGRGRSSTTCFMTSVEFSRCTPGRAANTSSSSR